MSFEDCVSCYAETYPYYCISGGWLAAGMITMVLLVSGISVAVHVLIYRWIYKPRMNSQRREPVHDYEMMDYDHDGTVSSSVIQPDERSVDVDVADLQTNVAYQRTDTIPPPSAAIVNGRVSWAKFHLTGKKMVGPTPPVTTPRLKRNISHDPCLPPRAKWKVKHTDSEHLVDSITAELKSIVVISPSQTDL